MRLSFSWTCGLMERILNGTMTVPGMNKAFDLSVPEFIPFLKTAKPKIPSWNMWMKTAVSKRSNLIWWSFPWALKPRNLWWNWPKNWKLNWMPIILWKPAYSTRWRHRGPVFMCVALFRNPRIFPFPSWRPVRLPVTPKESFQRPGGP